MLCNPLKHFADHTRSGDHRGTPENPGRVTTLIERSFWETLPDPHAFQEDKVWGTAYEIYADKEEEVKQYLDIREVYGYTIHYTPFHPADGSPSIRTMVFIGTPDKEHFAGPQDPQELAEHIFNSIGPSGSNKEYLLALEAALEAMHPESGDRHVRHLANRIRRLEEATGVVTSPEEALQHELSKAGSTDEQEEIEK